MTKESSDTSTGQNTDPPAHPELHQQLQNTKSPLLKQLDLSQLTPEETQNALELLLLFEPQQHILKRATTWLFGIAGLLWFPLFFAGMTSLSPELLTQFRLQQYRLYLFLMSLWGIAKYRRSKQYEVMLHLSVTLGKRWYQLTLEDIRQAKQMSAFESIAKHPHSERKYIHLILIWLFLLLSAFQLVRQILLLFWR